MKRNFTLVEVLIAMGVCVVGVCSIMALFPVGISNSREASMAGMASTAADQMLHLVKACIVNPNATVADRESNFQNLTGYAVDNIVDDGTHLGKPGENAEPTDDSGWQKATTENSPFGTVMSQFISDEDTEIYVSSTSGVYKFVKGEDGEFDSIIRMWSEPVYARIDTRTDTGSSPLPRTMRFHVEVSWPAQKSYAKRQTAEYVLDVYCPKE